MAKKKKRSRKPKLLTKVINFAILAIAFARPIQQLMAGNTAYFSRTGGGTLAYEATFGLSSGSFDKDAGLKLYGPIIGAVVLKKAISMARKAARV